MGTKVTIVGPDEPNTQTTFADVKPEGVFKVLGEALLLQRFMHATCGHVPTNARYVHNNNPVFIGNGALVELFDAEITVKLTRKQ